MSAEPNYSPAELLALLPESERAAAIASLSEAQAWQVLTDWRGFWARPNQLPPSGPWRYWLVQAGRGFGKTRVGAETVREWTDQYPRIHLVAPTSADVRDVMIEGESGIMNCFPSGERPDYEPSKRRLTFRNGSMAFAFSADEPERLRGPQCYAFWADELAAWRFPEAWDQLLFGLRLGNNPRGVITTTPKPTALMRSIIADPHTAVTRGSTYDNRTNLAPAFFDSIIRRYEGTRLGRQELLAELLEDVPGALWKMSIIDSSRIALVQVRWDMIVRIVVAVDPAVTSSAASAETGIVVGGLTRSGHVIVLDDLSCKETPRGWGMVAVNAYLSRGADRIVGEVNNGGDLVEGNIRAVNPNVPYRAVRASRGKAIRAEPVAALYEQGRVHHVGSFPELEQQMCQWTPEGGAKSPDRMDALVWLVTELLIDPEPARVRQVYNPAGDYVISPI